MAEKLLFVLRLWNKRIALLIGTALFVCSAFVLLDISLRQVGASFGGTDEISGYVMAIASAWGMGFTLLELAHVRIDFLRQRMPDLTKVLFDLIAMGALALTVSTIAFRCWPVLEKSLLNDSRANTVLETPLWWVQLPWFAGWIWFAITAWLTLLAATLMLLGHDRRGLEKTIGVGQEVEP